MLLSISILTLWSIQNLKKVDDQGAASSMSGIFQLTVVILIIASIFAFTPHLSSTEFVLTRFYNGTGFNDNDLAS